MLARTYLTASELGLSNEFYKGLLALRQSLEDKEFVHHTEIAKRLENRRCLKIINMASVFEQMHCGTVGCILGWARFLALPQNRGEDCAARAEYMESMPTREDQTNQQRAAFDHLITPVGYSSGRHTVADVTKALDTYLMTGWPQWPSLSQIV